MKYTDQNSKIVNGVIKEKWIKRTKPIDSTTITFILLTTLLVLSVSIQGNAVFGQLEENNDTISNTVKVGGNGLDWDKYTPQIISINAGESVKWVNPMQVQEPHTVTFIKDKEMFPPLLVPFSIPNGMELNSTIQDPNVEPSVIPDASNPNSKLVLIDNVRASSPVVIDSTRTNVTHLPVNANYTFSGDESYINSGFMWPEGMAPPGVPPISSFTLAFESPGRYDYLCVIHPWMSGTITVK